MSKNKPVNDPLEAAKVGKDAPKKSGWGKNKGKSAPPPEVRQAAPEPLPPAPTPAPAATPAPVEAAATPAPVEEAAKPTGVLKFKVRKTKPFSRNGQMTVLKEGSVISSQHYGGMPGIEKLRSCGIELDPVEG